MINRRKLLLGGIGVSAIFGGAFVKTVRAGSQSGGKPANAQASRQILTADLSYYVRVDGSDDNDGLTDSSSGAFQTIQKAIDTALNGLDFAGHNVTVQIGDGTYTSLTTIAGPQSGQGTLNVFGNPANPQNVIISTTDTDCFEFKNIAVNLAHMELRTEITGNCLHVTRNTQLEFFNLRFGKCARTHVNAHRNCSVNCSGEYYIVGKAQFHYHAKEGGQIFIDSGKVKVINTLFDKFRFGGAFAAADDLGLIFIRARFIGSARGIRYRVRTNGVINTGGSGQAYFPGDLPGTIATGGQYV